MRAPSGARHRPPLLLIAAVILTVVGAVRWERVFESPRLDNGLPGQIDDGSRTGVLRLDSDSFGTAFTETKLPEFANFGEWVVRYTAAANRDRPAMAAEGVRLATIRRRAMKALIRTAPEMALSLAVPSATREKLPEPIVALLEERVNEAGNFYLQGVVPVPGQPLPPEPVQRTATLDQREYYVHVFGRAAQLLSRRQMPMNGIAVDRELALADDLPGTFFGGKAWGDPFEGTDATINKPSPAWTHGLKKVLLLRVEFSDLPGEPIVASSGATLTLAVGAALFNQSGGINDFYAQSSYAQTSFVMTAADVSPLYLMPKTAAYYAQGDGNAPYLGSIRDSARAAAAADYDLSQYDRIGVVCTDLRQIPNSRVNIAGIASIDGEDFFINGFYDFRTVAHEVGHTFGVYHANQWKPADGTTIGTEAEMLYNMFNGELSRVSSEYSDNYDIMGSLNGTPGIQSQFNPWLKSVLGWLPNAAVQNIQTSGVYRVYRFDDQNADLVNHKVALKIGRDILREYWISYRRQPSSYSTTIGQGAYITYGYFLNRASDLLVCNNPGSYDVNDASLRVGQSLVDAAAGVTITTLAQGGTAPHEYLDMQVTLQPRLAFRFAAQSVETSAGNAVVVVERQGGASGLTTVNYATKDGTAISGTHYTGGTGTLTWADGDTTSRTISFPILGYPAPGGEAKFTVQLSNPVNGVLINPSTLTVSLRPPGNYDPTYVPDITDTTINSIDLQPDGKQLIAGQFTRVGFGIERKPAVGRYARINADGKRDFSFDSTVGANNDVNVIRVQPDGRILIGGIFTNINNASPARPSLARLNNDGSLDTSFNPPAFDKPILALAVQPDGKIVVGGVFENVGGQPCRYLCRLLPTGAVDFRFSDSSYIASSYGYDGIRTILLDNFSSANGVRIIAAGDFFKQASPRKAGIFRLNPDGSIDSSFDVGNGAKARGTNFSQRVCSVAIQPDGKLIVGGDFTGFGASNQKYLARLNSDGSVDPTFAPSITNATGSVIKSIALQSDGKVAIGGYFLSVNGALNKNVARVTATGGFDSSWDDGFNENNGVFSKVTGLLLRADGRLLLSTEAFAADYFGHIRGAYRPFDNSGVGGGYSTMTLFAGLPGLSGQARFAASSASVRPGNSVNLTVQRLNGSTGPVKIDYSTQDGSGVAGVDYVAARGTLSWSNGDTTSRTITISSPAGATNGRKFRVNLAIPNGGLLAGDPASLIVTTDVNAITGGFTGGLGNTGGSGGGELTLTGSAATAFMAYAFGANATTPTEPNMPQAEVAGDRLRIRFARDPLKTDLIYEVQASDDLNMWTTIARSSAGNTTSSLGAAAVSEAPAGALLQVMVDDSVPLGTHSNRFLRVRISQ